MVANINDLPTGVVVITGTPTEGQTLAAANTLVDADGMGTVSYQWLAALSNIAGATASIFVLTAAEVGKSVTVVARYVDSFGTTESMSSSATKPIASSDTTPPTVTLFSPADEATSVAINSDLVLTFSEPIAKGTGSIVLKTAAGVTIATYDAASSSNLGISGSTLTVNPSTNLSYATGYQLEFAAGTIKDLAGNAYAGTTTYNFTTASAPDTAAPTVVTFSPLDEATSVGIASNMVVTFSEAIAKGTGSIVLKTAAGVTVATYDAATSTNLSISGTTLTVNPSADLAFNTGYKLEFAAGTIKDLAGNAYAGTTSYNFTTVANTVADDYAGTTATTGTVAIGGSSAGKIEVLADQDWFKVTLTAGTSYEFTLAQTTGGLADPFLELYNPSAAYITSDDDSGGGRNSKITYVANTSGTYYLAAQDYGSGTGAYTLSAAVIAVADTTPPTVSSFSPADEATGVTIASNIVVTFSEAIAKGTGSIVLKTAAGVTVATYDAATSTNLSISGNTLTVNPTADLGFGTGYKLEFAAGSIKDLAGNAYAGTTSYNFTTKAATDAPKVLTGSSAAELFTGGSGNDTVDGGAGIDTVAFTGTRASHAITKTATGWLVSSPADGTDTLKNVERLQFSDSSLALDLDAANSAGGIYRLYGATFNRTPDLGGLGYWIAQADKGKSAVDMAIDFTYSAEFQTVFATKITDNYATGANVVNLVTGFYQNVLHRTPDAAGRDWYANEIITHSRTVGQVLAEISDSPENVAQLAGVIANGIVYTPFGG
jgi:methionine-rich copper-binding protein CopC